MMKRAQFPENSSAIALGIGTEFGTALRTWHSHSWLCAFCSLFLLFVLAGAPAGRAQGSRRDDVVFGPAGHPMSGATITVCTATAIGNPCAPLAALFTDATLTVPSPNPFTTDSLGNYHFYAAPGRYQLQITGPGITNTIQLNDVILPNDPSTPAFTTVTTSGAISAATLSLGGNLTVGGNASVTGSLTVAGGPVPSTGAPNNWSAAQIYTADAYFRSGVPHYDVRAFCAAGKTISDTTTGSITSGSTTLTLASALDFAACPLGSGQPGQGILVFHAGALPTISTPTGLAVATQGATGSTTYSYQVAAVDANGGETAATSLVSVATGNATLGAANNCTITSMARSNGTVTVTCSAAHNYAAGNSVIISGTTGGTAPAAFNGTFTIASVTSTTFTFAQTGLVNDTATGGTANVQNAVLVSWNSVANAIEYVLYGRTGSAPLAALCRVGGTSYLDAGQTCSNPPSTASPLAQTAPTSALADFLITTIASGAGTTSLTLSSAASTTATSQIVRHDDTAAFQAAINAAQTNKTGVVYVSGGNGVEYTVGSLSIADHPFSGSLTFLFDAPVDFYQPVLPGSGTTFVGRSGGPTGNFGHMPLSSWNWFGNNYALNNSVVKIVGKSDVSFQNIYFACAMPYADCVNLADNAGSPTTELTFKNCYFDSSGSPATGSVFSALPSATNINTGFDLDLTDVTFASNSTSTLPAANLVNFGIIRMQRVNCINHCISLKNAGQTAAAGDFQLQGGLTENLPANTPAVILDSTGGPVSNVYVHDFVQADGSGYLTRSVGNQNGPITIFAAATNNNGPIDPASSAVCPLYVFGPPGTVTLPQSTCYRFFPSGSVPVQFSALDNTHTAFTIVGRESVNAGNNGLSALAPLHVCDPAGCSGQSYSGVSNLEAIFESSAASPQIAIGAGANNGIPQIIFSRPNRANPGQIQYYHGSDTMGFVTGNFLSLLLNSSSATLGAGTTLTMNSTGGGSVALAVPSTASSFNATLPANSGTLAETNLAQSWSADQSAMTLVSPVIKTGISNSAPASGSTGFQHGNASTGCISAGARVEVTINWTASFADSSYDVACSVQDGTTSGTAQGLVLERVRQKTASLVSAVVSNPSAGALTGTLSCLAVH